jgi:hypothetical protein
MRGKAVSFSILLPFSILLLLSNPFNAWGQRRGVLRELVDPPNADRSYIDRSVETLDRLNPAIDSPAIELNRDSIPDVPSNSAPRSTNPSASPNPQTRALPQAYKTCQTPQGVCPLDSPALSGTTCFCDLGERVFGIAR